MLIHGPATIENAESSGQDLSFGRLFTCYAGRGIELGASTFAKNLGLLTADGRYNVLAQLMSDNSTLAPGQTVEGFFRGESVPVNKALSDLFLQLNISGCTGRGVPRIVGACGRDCYDFWENSIAMTIPFHRIDDEARGDRALNRALGRDEYTNDASSELTPTQGRVLCATCDDPNAT